ncbi:MAG: beta-propeller domain-containing protein [Ruminococcus sp.]|nr:beta-propeller domain-containing protein [Ruminococcus sp.]
MKNDLDFIKAKFDESGVSSPADMGKDFALELTKDKKQKKRARFDFRSFSAAAVLAVFVLSSYITASHFANLPDTEPVRDNGKVISGIMRFNNRKAIKKTLAETDDIHQKNALGLYFNRNENNFLDDETGSSAGLSVSKKTVSFDSASGSASHNATYIQETGVDEADCVKTTSTHIFYMDEGKITIFSARGKNSGQVGTIKPTMKDDSSPREFYICGDRLVLLESGVDCVRAETFDISDIKNIKLVDSFTQSGDYTSSRMTDGRLYIVSDYYAEMDTDIPKTSRRSFATDDEATPDELPPTSIYCTKKPQSPNFLVVSEIDINSDRFNTTTKALLGSAEEIYCNQEHLYVTAGELTKLDDFYYARNSKTEIFKIDLRDGLKFTASAKIKGEINNQYSMDEKDGNLRVAATYTSGGKEYNKLYVLDSELKPLGSTKRFAKDESIKAVRYIGNTAYVITYEETDPLFVIDLKDPKKPEILGEVKISGFSTLLVPIDEKTLLGLGYHTQDEDDGIDMEITEGLKLVTFDISDKKNPKVLDTKIYKNCSSAVQYDPKALVVNFERNDFTIPFNKEGFDKKSDCYLCHGGMLNFRVENGRLVIVDNYLSPKFKTDAAERCAFVGDDVYIIGEVYNEKDDDFKVAIDSVKYK